MAVEGWRVSFVQELGQKLIAKLELKSKEAAAANNYLLSLVYDDLRENIRLATQNSDMTALFIEEYLLMYWIEPQADEKKGHFDRHRFKAKEEENKDKLVAHFQKKYKESGRKDIAWQDGNAEHNKKLFNEHIKDFDDNLLVSYFSAMCDTFTRQ